MASVERLQSGLYRGVYRDAARKKCHTKKPHFARKRDALHRAQELEAGARRDASHSQGATSAGITWGEWWDRLAAKRNLDSETPVTEHYIVERHLRRQWGEVRLNHITRDAVQEWVDELKVGKTPGYTQRIYSVFSVSINQALRAKVLLASPCAGIDLPRRGRRPKAHTTTDDVDAIRPQMRTDYADCVEFILETGLRPGELGGLHVHRVDLESGWLEVVEVHVGGRTRAQPAYIRPYPKDEDSRRIPLTERAIEIARRQLADRALFPRCGLPHSDGGKCDQDLLFRTVRGKPVAPHNLQRVVKSAFDSLGMSNRSPYASRRGFATRLAEGGANAFEIAEWMGHADVRMSQEYVQQTAAARGRLRAALGERPPLSVLSGPGTGSGTEPVGQSREGTGIGEGEQVS